MAAKKRVLLTVNPFLVTGKRMMTQRSLVTALDQHADLIIATAGDYDFAQGLVRAYRRIRGGKFEGIGMLSLPQAAITNASLTDTHQISSMPLALILSASCTKPGR